jgi:hypothetical protein
MALRLGLGVDSEAGFLVGLCAGFVMIGTADLKDTGELQLDLASP